MPQPPASGKKHHCAGKQDDYRAVGIGLEQEDSRRKPADKDERHYAALERSNVPKSRRIYSGEKQHHRKLEQLGGLERDGSYRYPARGALEREAYPRHKRKQCQQEC